MTEKVRRYRMFKRRVAEMDLYQEYRRSHERVKVMLSEKVEEFPDKPVIVASPQDNLKKFIQQHEIDVLSKESSTTDKNFISLAEDTILHPPENTYSPSTNERSFSQTFSDQDPIEDNFINNSFQTYQSEEEAHSQQQIEPFTGGNGHIIPERTAKPQNSFQSTKVDDELENIIRDALYNINPISGSKDSDVDPELLNLMKDLLLRNPSPALSNNSFSISNSDKIGNSNFDVDYQDDISQQFNIPSVPFQQDLKSTKLPISKESKAEAFEKQLQHQQAPPKLPTRTTATRPDGKTTIRAFETTFTTTELEDDSSLAITKKELSLQVKNLIKETLEENKTEKPRPNDLLELEKQLKEHIEKIKQSRKEL